MFGLLGVALLATVKFQPSKWYGPVTAVFKVRFNGNTFDPAENDVHVRFTGPKGIVEDRLAYFDPKLGAWAGTLVTHEPGSYRAQLVRNGKVENTTPTQPQFRADHPLAHGFIRVDPDHSNRFIWDDGTPETPIGFDLGWQSPNFLDITDQLAKMGANGVNWSRIWACSWDGKNPWWPQNSKQMIDGLWEPALDRWSDIVGAGEKSGVSFQMVLFHHGEFASQTDPNWPDNPWNAKNGGFLKDAGDFFTDPEAKHRAKIWLRYAVARYGSSPAIFAWELFNEVQWVDAVHENRWADIETWHKEMADYVRSIDVYHHPVTSSSEIRPNLVAPLDYIQPHTYPADVFASVFGSVMPTNKPGFYGEFGAGDMGHADVAKTLRDGLYGGLLANHAASGMLWYWDLMKTDALYREYAVARQIVESAHWWKHPSARPASLKVLTDARSTFDFIPGGGWGPSNQMTFDLPDGADAASRNKLSAYLQGMSHPDLGKGPLTLTFSVPKDSMITIHLGGASAGGASVHVRLDGMEVGHQDLPGNDHSSPTLTATALAGSHKLEIENTGPDWVMLNRVSIENLGPGAQAYALTDSGWVMARVTSSKGAELPQKARLASIPLNDGTYDVRTIDLGTGTVTTGTASVANFALDVTLGSPDEILLLQQR